MPALAAPGGSRHAVIRKSHLPIHRYAGFQARQDEFFFTKCAHPLCIFLHQRAGQPLKTVLASHSQSQQHYIPAFRIIECDIRKEFVPKLFFLRGKSVQDRCRPTCLPINPKNSSGAAAIRSIMCSLEQASFGGKHACSTATAASLSSGRIQRISNFLFISSQQTAISKFPFRFTILFFLCSSFIYYNRSVFCEQVLSNSILLSSLL